MAISQSGTSRGKRADAVGTGVAPPRLTPVVRVSEIFPIVETAKGKLRGLVSGGIHVFKGIRYGANTAGRNRFLPPQPITPWRGVRNATAYGNYSPQVPIDRHSAYMDLIMYDVQPGGMGEDCLVLNVWTPTLSKTARKPVMVHLHGGGFYGGSGNSPQFDGEMLARFGDAVVVTLNHRLASFGFLNLAELGGERYAQSGAVGMLDIVAALRWVNENIEAFGGDPSRVLVFGQSGGAQKTSVLIAMPSAKGLFHRAGVMSGSMLKVAERDTSVATAGAFLKTLGLTKATMHKLHTLSFHQLLAAQITVEEPDRSKGEAPRAFLPALDGTAIPRHPFDPDAPAVSADVPMLVGTVLDERAYRRHNFDLDETGLRSFADGVAEDKNGSLLAMYRAEDPLATPFVIQSRIDSDMTFRLRAHIQTERKAVAARAPVYTYLWTIPSPAFDKRYGATHGVDVGPSMHDVRNGLNGPTPDNLRLADQLASAWIGFAATGNPANRYMPPWPAYTPSERATMVFAEDSHHTHRELDPRKSFREFWASK